MKIIEIGTGYTPIPAQMGAATEIVVEELTRAFLKIGQDVEIIDIAAQKRAETDLPISEVKVPRIFTKTDVSLGIMHKLKRVFYSIALARYLKKCLKKEQEKVVLHFHNQYNLFFFLKLVSKRLRQKAVIAYTVHSYIWGTEWKKIKDTVKKKYFQEIFCVKNADKVLVLNDITIEHFVSQFGVNRENIVKIINGVNVEKYTPLEAEHVEKCKTEKGLGGKKIIFQVGSVCERKNQLGSVQMLTKYLQQNKDVVYTYAGGIIDAEYQKAIEVHAKINQIEEQVRYVGELAPGNQLNEYYNMADCSVFTSKLESFGLVIIEAISAGTPVIVGSKPLFELKSGYQVFDSEEEFVQTVDKILQNGKQTECNGAEVVERYNWTSVAGEYMRHFNETACGEGKE